MDSLFFFGLDENFTQGQLKEKYYQFAKKYHPDSGEYSTEDIFIEVLKHKEILENFLLNQTEASYKNDYEIYKKAKQLENESIRIYFEKRKLNLNRNSPNLEYEKNLKVNLLQAKILFETLIQNYPNSIWIKDSIDSIQSINNWLRQN